MFFIDFSDYISSQLVLLSQDVNITYLAHVILLLAKKWTSEAELLLTLNNTAAQKADTVADASPYICIAGFLRGC